MPRYCDNLKPLTTEQRRALLTTFLDVSSGDWIVTTVWGHARYLIESLEREQAKPGVLVEHAEERIAAAVACCRVVRPALAATLEHELARLRADTEPDAERFHRRMHAEHPTTWPTYENRCAALDRAVETARKHLAECDAILVRHAPDDDLARAAADRAQPA